ncbi:alkane 1-monooxygenase [Roseobacter sp. EG26]|uniref:alkane 1-monooxygenase n=1 Tax=Roseobacter sp. EG26 TaxID=3412477 RepID=UPI003CE4BAE9
MNARLACLLFASASLTPAICLFFAALVGGVWSYLALFSITVLVLAMDRSPIAAAATTQLKNWLPRVIILAHFLILPLTVWSVGRAEGGTPGQIIALLLGAGLFIGQVSNACAHELIHRRDRLSRLLGTAIYCSILNGQHVSAHLLVHHVHAGTAKDPNSAPLGEGFWRYFLRVLVGEFKSGLHAENKRNQGYKHRRTHPYLIYIVGAFASIGVAFLLSGSLGVLVLIALSLHAQMQLMLSDYLQHYGLRRRLSKDGNLERMGPQHSWNAPQAYSAALMLNAPLHSDHHVNPGRPFSELRHDTTTMPTLPRSVPVMGAVALIPPLWRQIMDPRVQHYCPQGDHGNVMPPPAPDTGGTANVLSQ